MITIVDLSLVINVAVAGFWGVVLGFFPRAHFRNWPFGGDTPGSRILSSLYLTIAFLSLYALADPARMSPVCPYLFGFQIVYKSLSAVTVRDFRNPVVLSNILIMVIHSISLGWLLKHGPQ
jgi:hypothetical protein